MYEECKVKAAQGGWPLLSIRLAASRFSQPDDVLTSAGALVSLQNFSSSRVLEFPTCVSKALDLFVL